MKKEKKPRGQLQLWLFQLLIMIVLSAAVSLSLFLGTVVHHICLYVLLPLLSAITAAHYVYHGLNNYLALVAAPVVFPLCYTLIWGYRPDVGPFIVCSLITVFGSAYGEIRRTTYRKGR